ncbi:MAG: hypothetical protein U9Q69_06355 [Nanoarchaeota archaeon]|nr:hypothetical protein [Nanoarchaeota archaeon]
MIKNKKGMDISLNYIIIAVLAIIALIIIALFFTGGLTTLFKKQAEIAKASQQELALAKANCDFWCQTGAKENFENPPFSEAVRNAKFTSCTSFDEYNNWIDDCASECKGAAKCVIITDKAECSASSGCSWVPK